jgi:hypothetical protein
MIDRFISNTWKILSTTVTIFVIVGALTPDEDEKV